MSIHAAPIPAKVMHARRLAALDRAAATFDGEALYQRDENLLDARAGPNSVKGVRDFFDLVREGVKGTTLNAFLRPKAPEVSSAEELVPLMASTSTPPSPVHIADPLTREAEAPKRQSVHKPLRHAEAFMKTELYLLKKGFPRSEMPLPHLKKQFSDVGVKFAREKQCKMTENYGVKSSKDVFVASSPPLPPLQRAMSDLGDRSAPSVAAIARARGVDQVPTPKPIYGYRWAVRPRPNSKDPDGK